MPDYSTMTKEQREELHVLASLEYDLDGFRDRMLWANHPNGLIYKPTGQIVHPFQCISGSRHSLLTFYLNDVLKSAYTYELDFPPSPNEDKLFVCGGRRRTWFGDVPFVFKMIGNHASEHPFITPHEDGGCLFHWCNYKGEGHLYQLSPDFKVVTLVGESANAVNKCVTSPKTVELDERQHKLVQEVIAWKRFYRARFPKRD
jgi:hypothetical protein